MPWSSCKTYVRRAAVGYEEVDSFLGFPCPAEKRDLLEFCAKGKELQRPDFVQKACKRQGVCEILVVRLKLVYISVSILTSSLLKLQANTKHQYGDRQADGIICMSWSFAHRATRLNLTAEYFPLRHAQQNEKTHSEPYQIFAWNSAYPIISQHDKQERRTNLCSSLCHGASCCDSSFLWSAFSIC